MSPPAYDPRLPAAEPSGSPRIGLAASTWLGIALEAGESGDRARCLAALMAIDDQAWEGIRARLADLSARLPLF